jgi:hypothetical protein
VDLLDQLKLLPTGKMSDLSRDVVEEFNAEKGADWHVHLKLLLIPLNKKARWMNWWMNWWVKHQREVIPPEHYDFRRKWDLDLARKAEDISRKAEDIARKTEDILQWFDADVSSLCDFRALEALLRRMNSYRVQSWRMKSMRLDTESFSDLFYEDSFFMEHVGEWEEEVFWRSSSGKKACF